jgi:hypothetical protein
MLYKYIYKYMEGEGAYNAMHIYIYLFLYLNIYIWTFCKVITNFLFQSQVPAAYTYNPSYSGGRDQEDHCSKPAWANSLRDPISKIPNTKNRPSGVRQVVECLTSKHETLSSNSSTLSSNSSTAKKKSLFILG